MRQVSCGITVLNEKIPQHVAIVMDGNGRWAEKRQLLRFEGHKAGVESVRQIVQYCLEQRIAILSLFAFSSENWTRPAAEVNFLMELFLQALQQEVVELNKNGVKLCFIGKRDDLSAHLQQQMLEAEVLTQHNQGLTLNVAINYGGRWDITQATKEIAKQVQLGQLSHESINEELLASYLSTKNLPEPDLFIRTSGEKRLSNFFLWQLAYTELYFTEVYWPDFTIEEFKKALLNFSKRQRRYGKIS